MKRLASVEVASSVTSVIPSQPVDVRPGPDLPCSETLPLWRQTTADFPFRSTRDRLYKTINGRNSSGGQERAYAGCPVSTERLCQTHDLSVARVDPKGRLLNSFISSLVLHPGCPASGDVEDEGAYHAKASRSGLRKWPEGVFPRVGSRRRGCSPPIRTRPRYSCVLCRRMRRSWRIVMRRRVILSSFPQCAAHPPGRGA